MSQVQKFFLAIGLTMWGSLAFAGGDDRGGFGMRCKRWFNAVWDPWTKAAMTANLEQFQQPILMRDNMVVAPLWKKQGSPDVNPINWLRQQLPAMKEAGITTVYLPPMVPQTLLEFHNPADGKTYHNDHGYWGSQFNHSAVDPKLGTMEEYQALLKEAKDLGLNMALDINMRHFGYMSHKYPFGPADGGKIKFHDMELDLKNPDHFYQDSMSTMDLAKFETLGPSGQDIITQRKMWDLPALNVNNPEIRKRMIADQVSLVDLGYHTFRIDAAKHVPSDYLTEVIAAMSKRIKEKGGKPRFILEYLSGNYAELAVKLSELGVKDGVYFIDFPLSGKVRESVLQNGSFSLIKDEVEKMEGLGLDQGYFIQAITDQDAYYPPMYHGTDRSLQNTYAVTMMSNVLSTNRPYYVAGLETAVPEGTPRNQPSTLVDTASPAFKGIETMNHYFNQNFANLAPFESGMIEKADGGQLVVRRPFKDGKKSLLMVIDRSRSSKNINTVVSKTPGAKQVFRWGEYGGEVECYMAEVPN
jgi:hypothetical protein